MHYANHKRREDCALHHTLHHLHLYHSPRRPLLSLFAVHPELHTPVLQIIHRVIATHLFKQAGLKRNRHRHPHPAHRLGITIANVVRLHVVRVIK